ncbi:MAG: formyltransferase family protein [Pseudomonadota bacterium]|nr:formyltransferase family protein [Pseudomonadota bacterium]
MKQTFGDRVKAWYRLDNNRQKRFSENQSSASNQSNKEKLLIMARSAKKRSRGPGSLALAMSLARTLHQKLDWRHFGNKVRRAEERMFGRELRLLKKDIKLSPIDMHPSDVSSTEFVQEIRDIAPYFFLSLGGPLYRQELLDCITGVAINQHAGHSPDYKGTHTTEWALYHRNLTCISSTVHVTTSGADAGPILRRSNPCIFPDDTPATIFLRVAALGTELMIETVQSMISNNSYVIFPQPITKGMTYIGKNMPPHVLRSVFRDFKKGWLQDELLRRSKF